MLKWAILIILVIFCTLSIFVLKAENSKNASIQYTTTIPTTPPRSTSPTNEDEDAIARFVEMCRMLFGLGMEATDYAAKTMPTMQRESIDIWRMIYGSH